MECGECGKSFDSPIQLDEHDATHMYRRVSDYPLVLSIKLPDGCTPGRREAAEAFADAVKEIQKKYPERVFTFTPFDHERSSNFGGVIAWLAIAQADETTISVLKRLG